jgi:hypothetical protein
MIDEPDHDIDANELSAWLGVTPTAVRDRRAGASLSAMAGASSCKRAYSVIARIFAGLPSGRKGWPCRAGAPGPRAGRDRGVEGHEASGRACLGGRCAKSIDLRYARSALMAVSPRVQSAATHLLSIDLAAIDNEIRSALTALAGESGFPADGKSNGEDEAVEANP